MTAGPGQHIAFKSLEIQHDFSLWPGFWGRNLLSSPQPPSMCANARNITFPSPPTSSNCASKTIVFWLLHQTLQDCQHFCWGHHCVRTHREVPAEAKRYRSCGRFPLAPEQHKWQRLRCPLHWSHSDPEDLPETVQGSGRHASDMLEQDFGLAQQQAARIATTRAVNMSMSRKEPPHKSHFIFREQPFLKPWNSGLNRNTLLQIFC